MKTINVSKNIDIDVDVDIDIDDVIDFIDCCDVKDDDFIEIDNKISEKLEKQNRDSLTNLNIPSSSLLDIQKLELISEYINKYSYDELEKRLK